MLFKKLLGQQGVAASESPLARKVGRIFFHLSLMVTLVLAYDLSNVLDRSLTEPAIFGQGYVLTFFIVQVLTLLCLVKEKKKYLKKNWAALLIIALGIPLVLGHMTQVLLYLLPCLMLILLLPWIDACLESFSQGRVGAVLWAASITILLMGILVRGLAPEDIHSFDDGLWWAFSTGSLLGVADNAKGLVTRLLSIPLVIFGYVMLSSVAAGLASFFVRRGHELLKEEALEESIKVEQDYIRQEEEKILVREDEISVRLEAIEKSLEALLRKQ